MKVFELNVWRPLVDPRRGAARPGSARDRGGGCVLPARHSGHVLSHRARQDVDWDPGPRPRRPAARLLSQRRLLRADGRRFRRGVPSRGAPHRSRVPAALRGGRQAGQPAAADRPRARSTVRLRFSGRTSRGGPSANPFRRYAARFPGDLAWLAGEPLAFSTTMPLRRCGSAAPRSSSAGAYLRWLEAVARCGLERAAEACELIATTAKALQFKTARAVNTRKTLDPAPMLETMAGAWDETMMALTARYGA